VIADFGCGDAKLARSLPNKVHSFDLVSVSPEVTACDMSRTPLSKASVDVAVFCLSLMGTNLADYLKEANRVLKPGYAMQFYQEYVYRPTWLHTIFSLNPSAGCMLVSSSGLAC
jgi:Hypothetical methyltransferase